MIFLSRNLIRLNKEFSNYAYNPLNNSNFQFIGGDKEFHYRYNTIMKKNFINYDKKINVLGKSIAIISKKR